MRGKVGYIHPFCHGVGITPAYAGKRSAGREFGTAAWDHPRACGEKAMSVTTMNKSQGSPPRMRGKERYFVWQEDGTGITPAYAGKSVLLVFQSAVNRDHPRICGEKLPRTLRPSPRKGSPPHMRGKVNEKKANGFDIRITPAYAGKSTLLCFPAEPGWDHPRICGEKSLSGTDTGRKEGSPPHMRGKGNFNGAVPEPSGITPAYAGKSESMYLLRFLTGDHPRICGEKLASRISKPAQSGSPPHMRGKD